MANDIITNLHPDNDPNTNLYPNIKKENIPNKSISTDKLDDNVLSLIGSLKPSGTDTSINILAFTSNKGIYVATDNGHWYYWNGSSYADGGVYQGIQLKRDSVTNINIKDRSVTNTKIEDGSVDTSKISNDSITTNKLVNGSVKTEKIEDGAITRDKLDKSIRNMGSPTDEQASRYISEWLEAHPEARLQTMLKSLEVINNEDITERLQAEVNKTGIITIYSNSQATVYISDTILIGDNTLIYVADDVTIKKKDNINKPIYQNEDTTNGNYNISIIGGVYDFNGTGNQNYKGFGFLFNNVKDLTYKNLTLLDERKYCSLVCNCEGFIADNITFNTGSDGIHFQPPLKNARITNIKGKTGDDMIAFTLGDYSAYEITNTGDFENIVIDTVFSEDAKAIVKITGGGANANNIFKNIQINNLNGSVIDEVVAVINDNLGGNTHLMNTKVYGLQINNCSVKGGRNHSYLLSYDDGDVTLNNIVLSGKTMGVYCNQLQSLNISNLYTSNIYENPPIAIYLAAPIKTVNISNVNIDNTNFSTPTRFMELNQFSCENINLVNINYIGKKVDSDYFIKFNDTCSDSVIKLNNVNVDNLNYFTIMNANLELYVSNIKATNIGTMFWAQIGTPKIRVSGEGNMIFNWAGTFAEKSLNSRTITLSSYKGISELQPHNYDMVVSTKSGEAGLYFYNGTSLVKLG